MPDQGFGKIKVLDKQDVVYSFHFYYPHSYTHQGILAYGSGVYKGRSYPGFLRNFSNDNFVYWDKDILLQHLKAVADFQKKYAVSIFVGEFGVVRWAPGSERWVDDAISIFEEHGWSWCFHSLGDSWDGWNPTLDPKLPAGNQRFGNFDSLVLKVLMQAFLKNAK